MKAVQEVLERMVVSEDEVDNKAKKVEISTQTDPILFEVGTGEDIVPFNDLDGEISSSYFSRSLRNLFKRSKWRPSRTIKSKFAALPKDSDRLESGRIEMVPFNAETLPV